MRPLEGLQGRDTPGAMLQLEGKPTPPCPSKVGFWAPALQASSAPSSAAVGAPEICFAASRRPCPLFLGTLLRHFSPSAGGC